MSYIKKFNSFLEYQSNTAKVIEGPRRLVPFLRVVAYQQI